MKSKRFGFLIKVLVLTLSLFIFPEKAFSNFEKHFPLLNLLISAPIFKRENTKVSSNNEVYDFLQKLSKKSSHVKYLEMKLSGSDKGIPYLIISENGNYDSNKLTIWIQSMQHGDEYGSGEAALGLADFFSINSENILKDINILIFPRLNMYGAENETLFLKGDIDMNTDHALLSTPETQALKKELLKYNPEVILDIHEYPASRDSFAKLPTKKILPYYDILVSQPTNVNISDSIKSKQKNDIQNIKNTLEKKGITTGNYYSGVSEPKDILTLQVPKSTIKIARNNFALTPTFTFLIEGRGKDLGLQFFQRRVGSLEQTILTFVNHLKNDSSNIKKQILKERADIITEKERSILLLGKEEIYPDNFKFINLNTNKVEDFHVNMLIDFKKTEAFSRIAPLGYLIEPTNQKMITKLKRHSIIYSTLESEKTFTIESYRKLSDKKEYSLESSEKIFPAGTIFIDLKQSQKILILLLLEPESESSFVNLGILSSETELLPYYRIVEK
ncbi:MAG: M14 family zinc carboxypeptidase, partial [Fusobacteriaceae bacterium]